MRLSDAATGEEIRAFEGHASTVWGLAFSPDGRYVLSGSDDRTVRLWEVATGNEVRRFEGHSASVRSVAFSPDGQYALSGSWDGTLRLWSLPKEVCVASPQDQLTSVETKGLVIKNRPPEISVTKTVPNKPVVGEPFTIYLHYKDPDDDPIIKTYFSINGKRGVWNPKNDQLRIELVLDRAMEEGTSDDWDGRKHIRNWNWDWRDPTLEVDIWAEDAKGGLSKVVNVRRKVMAATSNEPAKEPSNSKKVPFPGSGDWQNRRKVPFPGSGDRQKKRQ